MSHWDDFFRHFYMNGYNMNNSYLNEHYGIPSETKSSNFIQDLATTLDDINKLLVALFDNSLPKGQIVSEKITIDDDGLFHLDLVVIREGAEKPTTHRVNISEMVEDEDEDDEDEGVEETTDYFTP